MNLSSEQLSDFFVELQGLVRAGVPLGHDLSLSARHDSRRVQALWRQVEEGLQRGEALSAALRGRLPQIGEATLALIRAGEECGNLQAALEAVAQAHRRRIGLERCLRTALAYPLLVLTFLAGLLTFFGLVVLPDLQQLAEVAGSVGGQPVDRTVTEHLMHVTESVCLWMASPPGFTVTALLFGLLWLWLLGDVHVLPPIQRRFFAWLPVIGHLVNLAALTRWTHVAGHLLQRRVTLPAAISVAGGSLDLPRLEQRSAAIREQIELGQPLSAAILSTGLLPPAAAGILLHAEARGDVPEALIRLAGHLQDRLDREIERFQTWFEPVAIFLAGTVVFAAVFALYVPLMLSFFRGTTQMFGLW